MIVYPSSLPPFLFSLPFLPFSLSRVVGGILISLFLGHNKNGKQREFQADASAWPPITITIPWHNLEEEAESLHQLFDGIPSSYLYLRLKLNFKIF